jgi:hypothetical protein
MENLTPNPSYRQELLKGKITSGEKDKPGYLEPSEAAIATKSAQEARDEKEYRERKPYILDETVEKIEKHPEN